MKKLFLLAVMALSAASCSEDEGIEMSQLTEGYWSETYDNPNFSMDSSVRYTFHTDGTYTVEARHALADTTETLTHHYLLQDNLLTLQPESPQEQLTYTIVLLNSKEMAWQRTGTSFTEGTLSSDYKHFKHYTASRD